MSYGIFLPRKYIICLSLVLILKGSTLISCQNIPAKKELWYKCVKEYVEAENELMINASKEKPTFIEDYSLLIEKKGECLKVDQPSSEEILSILNSDDLNDIKIALAAMAINPIKENDVLERIIPFMKSGDYNIKYYAILAIKDIDVDHITAFQDKIFNIIKSEKDEGTVHLYEIPILGKFNNPKYLPFIIDCLRSDSTHIKAGSLYAIREMNKENYEKVITLLRNKKDNESLKAIKHFEEQMKQIEKEPKWGEPCP